MKRWTITAARTAAGLGLALLFAAGLLSFGPDLIDDAYITFRYARNIAAGQGFVYNSGERVQGASSPLWTLKLAAGEWSTGKWALGKREALSSAATLPISPDRSDRSDASHPSDKKRTPPETHVSKSLIPQMALVFNVLSAAAVLALIVLIGRAMGRARAGWLAAALTAGQLLWIQNAVSGMETPLYQALLLGLLAAAARGRWRWIGPLAALAMLTRYDGALAAGAALGVAAWRGSWRIAAREAAVAPALYLPWFVWSWLYFGSPIPQSVQAKHLQTGMEWAGVWWHWRVIAKFMALPLVWLALAATGGVAVARLRDGWLVLPLWIALYAVVFAAQRMPLVSYPWYFVPLIPPLALLAAIGLESLCRAVGHAFESRRSEFGKSEGGRPACQSNFLVLLTLFLFFLLFSFSLVHLRQEAPLFGRGAPERREALYFRTAAALRPHLRPGDTVLVGEVGALGWALGDMRVIDSPGLVSRDAHAINAAFRDSAESVRTLRMLETLAPAAVTTKLSIMDLQSLADDPWFRDHYTQLTGRDLVGLDQWTFLKRNEPEN